MPYLRLKLAHELASTKVDFEFVMHSSRISSVNFGSILLYSEFNSGTFVISVSTNSGAQDS